MAVDKVIATNVTALKGKYGNTYAQVKTAIDALIKADLVRGLRTMLIAVDSPADMKRVKGKPVSKADDERGAKAAVDAIYKHYRPDYLLLLGAPDVVPHIQLTNPMTGTPDDDDDPGVPSDVPYACDAPWSRQPKNFVGPTRVVGRVPDLVGATDPAYLVKLLTAAAGYAARDRSDYSGHFAITAKVWTKSTVESVTNLFGPGSLVLTSPPGGPKWTKSQLAPRLHFINCHGDTVSPKFFGEFPKGRFVDAHDAAHLRTRVTKGSVIAAECCYGAELYNPKDARGQAGIANTYLGEGAHAFFGSTNIAYGPAEGQGQADLICQYFIESVLKGASLGRAALEARQRFVAQFSHVDPSDLKTAVQFQLLGDPSLQPIKATPHGFSRTKAVERVSKSGAFHSETRAFRRERLTRTGSNLSRTIGAAVPSKTRVPAGVRRFLTQAARESGIRKPSLNSYSVSFPTAAAAPEVVRLRAHQLQRSMYVALGSRVSGMRRSAVTAIIVTVEAGRIVHVRRVHSR
jgi:Peptidase family C25